MRRLDPNASAFLSALLVCVVICLTARAAPLFSDEAARRAGEIINEDLAIADQRLSPDGARSLRQEVENISAQLADQEAGLCELAATLRFLRDRDLWSRPPFNPQVSEQLQFLADAILRELRAGAIGQIPFSLQEQEVIARDLSSLVRQTDSSLASSFREPLSEAELAVIKDLIRARLRSWAERRDLLAMNRPGFDDQDRLLLWRGFIKYCLSQLLLKPLQSADKGAIRRLQQNLFGRLPISQEDPAQRSAPLLRPLGRLDIARDSEERVVALFLSVMPLLLNSSLASSSAARPMDLFTELRLEYEPCTQVKLRLRVAAVGQRWFVIISDVAANDGKLLGEASLSDTCFVFDRLTQSLSRSERQEGQFGELRLVARPTRPGILHLSDSYDAAAVRDIMNFTAALGNVLVLLRENPRNMPRGTALELIGNRLEVVALETLGARHTIFLDASAGNRPARIQCQITDENPRLTAMSFRGIQLVADLETQEAEPEDFPAPAPQTLFPFGGLLEVAEEPLTPAPASQQVRPLVTLRAPGRLTVQTWLLGFGPPTNVIVTDDVSRLIPSLSAEESCLEAKDVIRAAHTLFNDNGPAARRLDLLQRLERLERHRPQLLDGRWFWLRDAKIGLLNCLMRRDEARRVFEEQIPMLATVADPDFAEEYLHFYQRLFREQSPAPLADAAPSLVPDPCFSVRYWHPTPPSPPIRGAFILTDVTSEAPALNENEAVALPDVLGRVILESNLSACDKSVAANVLNRLWRQYPDLRLVDAPVAQAIRRGWAEGLRRVEIEPPDEYAFMNILYTLRWQTYHAARTFRYPLTPEAQAIKSQQFRVLTEMVSGLRQRLIETAPCTQLLITTMDAELGLHLRRLQDAFDSPFLPLCYYPTSEEAFSRVLHLVETRISAEIKAFRAGYALMESSWREQLLYTAARKAETPDFFGDYLNSWATVEIKSMVAGIVGEIFKRYSFERNLNFSDSAVFPFSPPESVQVTYRLIEGLDLSLAAKYVEKAL